MTIVRIVSPGWETFTGSLGFEAVFEDGVSVEGLSRRQIARIGSSLMIESVETGLQLGPAAELAAMRVEEFEIDVPDVRQDVVERDAAIESEKLAEAAKAQAAIDAAALAEAQAKAAAAVDKVVIYTRVELEAIGSNDGISGLREIATPLGVKARAITEMVNGILSAQSKLAVA